MDTADTSVSSSVASELNSTYGLTKPAPSVLPEPRLDARATEVLTFVVMIASLFGGNTWKSIASLAKAALDGTLTETALMDLEVLLAKHHLRL